MHGIRVRWKLLGVVAAIAAAVVLYGCGDEPRNAEANQSSTFVGLSECDAAEEVAPEGSQLIGAVQLGGSRNVQCTYLTDATSDVPITCGDGGQLYPQMRQTITIEPGGHLQAGSLEPAVDTC